MSKISAVWQSIFTFFKRFLLVIVGVGGGAIFGTLVGFMLGIAAGAFLGVMGGRLFTRRAQNLAGRFSKRQIFSDQPAKEK